MARLNSTVHPKLTDDAISRLRVNGINTVYDFVSREPERLMKILQLSYKDVLRCKETILETFGGAIRRASKISKADESSALPTGITSLDDLLKGGLRAGRLYEICGLSSSGKSQLCHTIAVDVASSSSKAYVRYIDTKRDFSASRVHAILEGRKSSDEEIAHTMDRIRVTRVTNSQELLNTLHRFKSTWRRNGLPAKLVIIDSLAATYLSSSTTPSDSNCALNHLSNVCRYLASEFDVSFIVVNLITQWRESDGFAKTEAENLVVVKPALGKYWTHIPDTRLLVEKLEGEIRRIVIWKSLNLEINSSCVVKITSAGVL